MATDGHATISRSRILERQMTLSRPDLNTLCTPSKNGLSGSLAAAFAGAQEFFRAVALPPLRPAATFWA